MGEKPEMTAETGLQFFGQISASVSHELKNVLAIINENAGLLDDFTVMADRGIPIDPARLKAMAEAVKKQIVRADAILKNMNRFAHSTDQTVATVDLAQMMELILAVTARFVVMRGFRMTLKLPENPVALQTAPYFLMNLVWQCLDLSMSAGEDQKRIEIVAEEKENGVRIQFRHFSGLTKSQLENFPTEPQTYLLEVLKADLTIDKKSNAIVLQLPNAMDI